MSITLVLDLSASTDSEAISDRRVIEFQPSVFVSSGQIVAACRILMACFEA